ncbi:MAG: hypothetical protein ACYSYL_14575 [Planctomycetota bacterium]|jgi:hypothetical protein
MKMAKKFLRLNLGVISLLLLFSSVSSASEALQKHRKGLLSGVLTFSAKATWVELSIIRTIFGHLFKWGQIAYLKCFLRIVRKPTRMFYTIIVG